jgi:hypothetical protein
MKEDPSIQIIMVIMVIMVRRFSLGKLLIFRVDLSGLT